MFLLATLLPLTAGCNPADDHKAAAAAGRLPVFAGIQPLAYLVEQIGGKRVKVDVLVQPGQDPHTFEPTSRQILALGQAVLFFKIDMPFENAILEKTHEANRQLKIVDATEGIQKLHLDADGCELPASREHGRETERGEPDPHVWLSPPLLKRIAKNIADSLCRADKPHERDYRRNLAAMLERLDSLDARVRQRLAPYRGRAFYVFHPGFAYFADAYGLREAAIEAGGREPTPKQLRTLVEQAAADGVKTIFIQPQYAPESALAVAKSLGGRVVTINGLAKDVIADIDDIAAKIENSMCKK